MSQLKKQKLEAAGSSRAVQALRMENDGSVVGPDAPTADSKMVKRDIATADWCRPTFSLRLTPSEQSKLRDTFPNGMGDHKARAERGRAALPHEAPATARQQQPLSGCR